ncbi:unnamed protein product [Diplocarpon coronariae]
MRVSRDQVDENGSQAHRVQGSQLRHLRNADRLGERHLRGPRPSALQAPSFREPPPISSKSSVLLPTDHLQLEDWHPTSIPRKLSRVTGDLICGCASFDLDTSREKRAQTRRIMASMAPVAPWVGSDEPYRESSEDTYRSHSWQGTMDKTRKLETMGRMLPTFVSSSLQ